VEHRTARSAEVLRSKYGVSTYFALDEFKIKTKQTKLKRYGNAKYVNPKKAQKTKFERYGNSNYNNMEKHCNTMLQIYGASNYSQTDMFRRMFFDKVVNRIRPYYDPKFTISEYTGVSDTKYEFQCKKCQNTFYSSIDNGKFPRCTVCYPKSKFEVEIIQYIRDELHISNIVQGDRILIGPKELDIVLPDHKIAIELNGVYWHTELKGKYKGYHLEKTKLCESIGYKLLHIWDCEWYDSPEIIKSILGTLLGKSKRISARSCSILGTVSNKDTTEFLQQHHLQGAAPASIRIGLQYNDELVSILTLSRSRYNKSIEYEIIRVATKCGVTVTGGLSKMWKHFIKTHTPNSVVTYSDKRFFSGKSYLKLGMIFDGETPPNYRYVSASNTIHSRIKFQKHKLSHILPIFDSNKTEWENMKDNGYDRLWDCGNNRYVF